MCGVLTISFYAISFAYTPNFSGRARKIITGLEKPLELLLAGTKKVLELDGAKKNLAEKTKEYETLAKRAESRVKNATNKRGSSSSYGSGGGHGGRGRGSGGYASHGSAPSRSSYGGYGGGYGSGYGSDYGSYNSPSSSFPSLSTSSTPTAPSSTKSSDSDNSPGSLVDPSAKKDAAARSAAKHAGVKNLKHAITLANRTDEVLSSLAAGSTAYQAAVDVLKNDGVFAKLSAAAKKRADELDAEVEASSDSDKKTATDADKKVITKMKELDTALVANYRKILPHVMFAATLPSGADSDARALLQGDMQRVGQQVIKKAAQARAVMLAAEWEQDPHYAWDKLTIKDATIVNAFATRTVPAGGGWAQPVAGHAIRGIPAGTPSKGFDLANKAAAAAPAAQVDAFKSSYKTYFEGHLSKLRDRRKLFNGMNINPGELGVIDTEINTCTEILRPLQ